MKLADSFKILSAAQRDVYARAQRAIGQDLATLFPETLEIEIQAENFIVRGQCAQNRLDAKLATPQKKGLKAFCADLLARDVATLARQAKSSTVEFTNTYSPEDINRIDEIGMGRRFAVGKMPDIRSLGEMLRTIGRLVDGREGRLVKISKDARRMVFDYSGPDGKSCTEIRTNLDLYKLQKSFYEARGEAVGLDPWKDRKFPGR
jgi:hypothetical protein